MKIKLYLLVMLIAALMFLPACSKKEGRKQADDQPAVTKQAESETEQTEPRKSGEE